MVEPFLSLLGTTAATTVTEGLAQQAVGALSRAKMYAADDVRACQAYSEAVHHSVVALEAEYDRLLIEAKRGATASPEQLDSVIKDIEVYLTVDRIRPVLVTALAGLQQCGEALKANADRILQWPWKSDDRQEAVRQFTAILQDLAKFADSLNAIDPKTEASISGVGAVSLREVQRRLEMLRDGRIDSLRLGRDNKQLLLESIAHHQTYRSHLPMLAKIAEIERAIRQLMQAFR